MPTDRPPTPLEELLSTVVPNADGKFFLTRAQRSEVTRKQRAALPPDATVAQKHRANFVPATKGQILERTGHPGLAKSFPDVMRHMLNATSIDVRITYANGRPDRNIRLDASESFAVAIAASIVSQAAHGNLKAAEMLMDRTEGKVTQTVADVTNRPFCITDPYVDAKEDEPRALDP